jgi:hypothetical protein
MGLALPGPSIAQKQLNSSKWKCGMPKHRSPVKCRLFGDLTRFLATGPRAFAVINSQRQVEIESMAWSAIPDAIQQQAVEFASNWLLRRREATTTWGIPVLRYKLTPSMFPVQRCCVVRVAPIDAPNTREEAIASEDTRPVLNTDLPQLRTPSF